MANNLLDQMYKPDVLTCLSDLSNDEVFTPPAIANQMLDLLPKEIWNDPNIKILDPACKSGVFLREAAKRFIEGEKDIYPNLQERLDHIYHKQLYGIAITELTSLMSRRSLYCSKYPNGPFSITHFDNPEGNIRYQIMKHDWDKHEDCGKCRICGASYSEFGTNEEKGLESHAYEFIHLKNIKEIQQMKFDVIISNPPYQLETAGAGRQAKPLYNLFVEQARKLNPHYLIMIIKSNWFSGGMGLDNFRREMMHDRHISKIVDYANAKDCFPGQSIPGGVCYFKWDKFYNGDCEFTNVVNGAASTKTRSLMEFPVLVRFNQATDIISKIVSKHEVTIDTISSSLTPYGMSTNVRGQLQKDSEHLISLYSSNGLSYITGNEITKGFDTVNKYKVMLSKTSSEHAGEPSNDGKYKVIPGTIRVLKPGEVCTHLYFVIGNCDTEVTAENIMSYLKTKFTRFLMLMCINGYGLSKSVLQLVPMQDFSHAWTDEELYRKYGLNETEINFIDSMIKPMD